MLRKIHDDDDFVLTISDNDELLTDDGDSNSLDEDKISNKKRKRDSEQRSKSAKKQKRVQTQSDIQSYTYDDLSSEDTTVQDGAIDPGFEFDLGTNEALEVFDDIDGWMAGTVAAPEVRIKKSVDIDAIIARRAVKGTGHLKHNDENNIEDESVKEAGDDEVDDDNDYGQENEEYGEDTLNLENDELLSRDAFGGNVESEDEDIMEGEEASNEQDKEMASESDSVASPTAHPEDTGSESSDDSTSQTSDDSTSQTSDDEEAAKRAAFFAPETETDAKLANTSSFQQFSLSRPILRALAALSFVTPTPIQSRAIPVALQGIDIVGSAVTGSGKTAAFLLPILERLLYRPRKIPITRVAILLPTRELAVQCHNVAVALARFTDITFAQVVGGFSLREQEAVLKKRPDVVIATPGRFIDHMRNSASFTVESIEILVLDEADRMLEDGFADELDEILRTIPKGRQTMLFSATMTESVDKLVRVGMNKPVRVSVDAKKSTVSGLVQEFVRLRPGREQMRLATLAKLCTEVFTERTIVFFRQKKEAHRVRIVLGLLGLRAGELHGSMSQEQRITAVTSFREGKITHLLATDLASRGLDIKNVMSVINYEAPQSHEIYLHRVGRTARAGRSGRSCTIAAEIDRKIVKAAVKAARSQGAKIVSRVMDNKEIDAFHQQVEALADEVEEIFREEKEEKAMAQVETQIRRGENIVKHQDEIMSRPKRTWFESEKEKRAAKERGKAELNNVTGVKFTGEKKRLSNKDKKRLDDRRERTDGRTFKKRKGDADAVVKANRDKKKARKSSKAGNKSHQTGGKSKVRR